MKKILIVFAFAVLMPIYCYSFQNEPDGFRGIKWETDITTLPNMTYVGDGLGLKLYKKSNEEMKLGSAKIDTLLYTFWRGKLSGVLIQVEGLQNCNALRDVVFERFGEGVKENQYIEDYYWSGKITFIDLQVNKTTGLGNLTMFSQKMADQKKAAEKQDAKEGAAKGF